MAMTLGPGPGSSPCKLRSHQLQVCPAPRSARVATVWTHDRDAALASSWLVIHPMTSSESSAPGQQLERRRALPSCMGDVAARLNRFEYPGRNDHDHVITKGKPTPETFNFISIRFIKSISDH